MLDDHFVTGLLTAMRSLYGKKFDDQWASVTQDELHQTLKTALSDLSREQLQHGMQAMLNHPFCPTVPEFRQWCQQGGSWLTPDEAWAQALRHVSQRDRITVQARDAFLQSRQILEVEGQRAAARPFRDVYARLVQEAQAAGQVQRFWEPVKLAAPVQPEPAVASPEVAAASLAKLKAMLGDIGRAS